MTTRFFDFRRYSYKNKPFDLPEIRKKDESSAKTTASPLPGTAKLTSSEGALSKKKTFLEANFQAKDDFNSQSPKTLGSLDFSNENYPTKETLKKVETKHLNYESHIGNHNCEFYDSFRSIILSTTPEKRELDHKPVEKNIHNMEAKNVKNINHNNSSISLKRENEKPNSTVSRKRLKRCIESDSDEEIDNNTLKCINKDLSIKRDIPDDRFDAFQESCDTDDEAAFNELKECLEVSEEMKAKIIDSLGGQEASSRKSITEGFQNGWFNAYKSYCLPEDLRSNLFDTSSKLKEYQKCGIHWLITLHDSHRNGILADEMGLGKTAQTCVFLNYLYFSGKISTPSVIATPASLLDNWKNEIEQWAPFLKNRVIKYQGKQPERREQILNFIHQMYSENPYFILITSINTLASNWDLQYLKQIKPVGYLVIDEAHSLKNEKSQVYRKLNKIFFSNRRLLLTGSPIQNKTVELKNLLLFVMPHVFNASSLDAALQYYEKQVCAHSQHNKINTTDNIEEDQCSIDQLNGINKGSIIDSIANILNNRKKISLAPDVQCLQKLLGPFILRRLKAEVLFDLPPKKNIVLKCELEGRQARLYLNEIESKSSRLVASLQKLGHLIDPRNDSSNHNSDNPATQAKDLSSNHLSITDLDKGIDDPSTNKENQTTSQTNKQFVNSLLSRLRRICNHPLLMQSYYTESQINEIIDHYHHKVQGFMGNPRKKVEAEIRKWSDFEIHQGIQHLVQSNDYNLQKFLIPKEALLESAKIRCMFELVENIYKCHEKVLIFSQFTTYLNIVEECLINFFPSLKYCRLDGTTNVIDRQNIVDNFNTLPDITIFLLSTKAGGQGLNLSSAQNIILMDQDWNPQNDRQAEDRVHRIGQSKEVKIYRIYCRATIEETILKCCQRKLDLDEAFGGDSEMLQAAILQESLYITETSNFKK